MVFLGEVANQPIMPPCIGYLSHPLSEAADLERSSGWVGVTHHQSRATLLEFIASLAACCNNERA